MPLTPEQIKVIADRAAGSILASKLKATDPSRTPREKELWAQGEEIARKLDNGVGYRGPWLPFGPDGEFVGHYFNDDAVTQTSLVCQNLEDCKADLIRVRKEYKAEPPVFALRELPFIRPLDEEEIRAVKLWVRSKNISPQLIHYTPTKNLSEIARIGYLNPPLSAIGADNARGISVLKKQMPVNWKLITPVVIPQSEAYKFKRVLYPYYPQSIMDGMLKSGELELVGQESLGEYGSEIWQYIQKPAYVEEMEFFSMEPVKVKLEEERSDFTIQAKPPVFTISESPREYWDKHLEHNPLRTMLNGQDTNAGAFLSHHLEGAGDILREFAKEYPDGNYIFEKFNRYKNNIDSRDWKDPLSKTELDNIEETKKLLTELPAPDEFHQFLKGIMFNTLNRDRSEINAKLPQFRELIKERLDKASSQVLTNQEKENPCPNLQPMVEWIKGETPGTCRPCTLTPVVQWYWEELKERGLTDIAAELEAEVEVLEEDNVEQVMAICKDLDEIKAKAPEDLRKRLEEFDCAIQSFDLAEVSDEAQPGD